MADVRKAILAEQNHSANGGHVSALVIHDDQAECTQFRDQGSIMTSMESIGTLRISAGTAMDRIVVSRES